MTDLQHDEEFGPFGQSAAVMINSIFPRMYKMVVVVSPSFANEEESNISPVFNRGAFFVVCHTTKHEETTICNSGFSYFSEIHDHDAALDGYRYEHAILASADLGIITVWAQAEYALVAFRGDILDEYSAWLEAMQTINVLRRVE